MKLSRNTRLRLLKKTNYTNKKIKKIWHFRKKRKIPYFFYFSCSFPFFHLMDKQQTNLD